MIRFSLFIFSVLLLLSAIGCANSNGTAKYTLLSQNEIDQFIQEKNIEPLAVEEVQNSTVILYNNGVYYLSKDNEELMENYSGWGVGHGKVQFGMTSTGSPHVYVILNDETLLKEANKVEVVFQDGKSVAESTEGNRGFLLFYDKNEKNMNLHNELELYIYDNNGEVLYQDNI
ncbi:hypothetical protein [Halobacillus sp. K22]|uniref:hypothetical protein n=1 Tax=Halobacillus sp. K22 TaxID=3457431 RepID=UPI003FCE6F41